MHTLERFFKSSLTVLLRLLPNSLIMVLVFSVWCCYFLCFLGDGEGDLFFFHWQNFRRWRGL